MKANEGEPLESEGRRPSVSGHRLARREGQSLVEFALVLPILLLIIVGILEFGIAFRTYQVVTNAAREGARTAVLRVEQPQADSVVIRYLQSAGLNPNDGTRGFNCEGSSGSSPLPCETGDIASVTVSQPVNFVLIGAVFRLIQGLGADFEPPEFVTSVSQMRTE